MNARERWKVLYSDYKLAKKYSTGAADDWRMDMWLCRREAALERKLEAAQRTIEAQAQRIAELDATLKDIATAPYENQPNDGNEWEKEYYLRGMHR